MTTDLPKHYSLAKEHPASFEIHDHRDDKRFHIQKKSIHPATQIKIMKMQRFPGGGDVEEGDVGEESATPDSAPEMGGAEDTGGIDTNAMVPQMNQQLPQHPAGWNAPMLPPEQMQEQVVGGQEPGQMSVPAPQEDPYADVPGMSEAVKGIQGQAATQQNMAQEQHQALLEYQNNLAADRIKQEQTMEGINQEQASLQKQLQDGKIDPDRIYSNMSTGQRIRTAIGLILGGIGSGLSHQPNLAIQVMNKAVDDDINAQKANLGKVHSLLSLNMQKYHNAMQAETATRLQYNTALQVQLQMAQAKATNGVAASALHMQMGGLQQQAAQYKQSLALMGAKAMSLGVGGGEGGIPEGQEPALLMLDPKYRENRVVVNGKAFQASDKENATKVRDVETLAGPVLEGVKKLQSLANDPSTRFAGSPNNLLAHGIMGELSTKMPLMAGAMIGAKRVNAEEIKAQHDRFQDPTRFDQTLGSLKNDQFFKSLEQEVEGMRSNHLIGYKGMGMNKSFAPASGKLPLNRK